MDGDIGERLAITGHETDGVWHISSPGFYWSCIASNSPASSAVSTSYCMLS